MQDEADQAGVGENRGLEGGRKHGEMAGAAEVEGFSSGGAGQKDESTAGGGLQEGVVCNVQAGTQRGVLLQAVDVTGSEMCDYEKKASRQQAASNCSNAEDNCGKGALIL